VLLFLGTSLDAPKDLDLLEFFCGCQSVTKGGLFLGKKAQGLDILSPQKKSQPPRNLGTKSGFSLALKLLCRMRTFGLTWWAPPCSNWVWMSRGTNKRSVDDPLGDREQQRVRWNNRLVSRLLILLQFARYLGLFWILEQPASSLILEHPKFNRRTKRLGARQTFLWMRSYGAESPKPTVLYGDSPGLRKLGTTLKNLPDVPTSTATVTVKDKKGRVCGGPDLQSTQAYPLLFGLEVAASHFEGVDCEDPTKGDSSASDDDSSGESYSCIQDLVELLPSIQ